jgi:putative transposase
VIDGSQTNHEAIVSFRTADQSPTKTPLSSRPVMIRKSKYLNNRIEQDHRTIKRRIRPMLGLKSFDTASAILSGIELVQMMRKQQARFACNPDPALAEQFAILAA